MPSALTAGLDIAPGHHDAAGAFYANVYENGCGCFKYRGTRQLIWASICRGRSFLHLAEQPAA